MALIALVNRVLPDPMLLHIVSSFHGDFRVEVKVLSLKRYWLAQNQELVRQHREKVEDILVWCMHRVGRFSMKRERPIGRMRPTALLRSRCLTSTATSKRLR